MSLPPNIALSATDAQSSITLVPVPTPAPAASSVSPATAKLQKAAGQFEAILLQSLWKSMKETFKDPQDEGSDATLESFDEWGMQGLATAVGSSGGLGIKNMILKYLEPRLNEGPASTVQMP